MVFLMYDIYISYMYYQFFLSQMGKKWFLWMSHYHARYKSEEISPIHGWKATDLLFMMIERRKKFKKSYKPSEFC